MRITAKPQAPGYYRQRVGNATVTALYDGYINLAPTLFHGLDAETMRQLIAEKFQSQTPDGVPTAVTTYLIDTGTDVILLNAGGSNRVGNTMGRLEESLHAAGYKPESVTAVLLTHMHFDHVCGLVSGDGHPVFPNATVFVSEAESAFWLDAETAKAAPKESRAFFTMASDSVSPYRSKNAFVTFADETEVRPGILAIPTPGHTPGHTSFLVRSGKDALLLWGDIVHSHALQFSHPGVTNDFDSDQVKAAETRRAIFRRAAGEKWLIGGDHLPFPGFGHLRERDEGYEWVPVEYAPYQEKTST